MSFSLINCKSQKVVITQFHKTPPPNGIEITNGWYADRSEVSNINYREFLHFIKHHYSDSTRYLKMLPDTTVWKELGENMSRFVTDYLRNPDYEDWPVVGVSYEQAVEYTKWRTDRVMEMILITQGIRKMNNDARDEEVFTIAKYFEKDINKLSKNIQVRSYYHFDLPSKEEWDIIVKYQESLYSIPKCIDSLIVSQGQFLNAVKVNNDIEGCVNVKYNEMFHVKGNVCEWIKDGKMCGGGSFLQSLDHIKATRFFGVRDPKVWVGFRNVCRFKEWE
jgi:hypothetical protein